MKEKKREQFEKNGDALSQGTGQVKLFTAVVNDVGVPEYIGGMLNPVYPVARKIKCNKGDDVDGQAFFNMGDGKMLYHPAIADDGNT